MNFRSLPNRWRVIAGAWITLLSAAGTTAARGDDIDGAGLQRMTAAQLDALYRSAAPGPTPRGKVRGVPIVAPGKPYGPAASKAARAVWQGKVFRDDGLTAVNRFFGLRVIEGRLSSAPSWVDGRPSLILDYQGTSRVYGRYRDEIRQVGPNLYLGVMFARTDAAPTFTRYFAFETTP